MKGTEENEMIGWHYRLNGHESERTLGDGEGGTPGMLQSIGSQRVRYKSATEQQQRQRPLEKGMTTHPSILAWRIPRTEEPGGLQSIGSQRVGHN